MDTTVIQTRNKAILDEQERILNSAHEAKRKISADEEISFTNLTQELDANTTTINRFEAINKGKQVIAAPREPITLTGQVGSKKTYTNCTTEYATSFFNALSTRNFTNVTLGESGAAADGGYLYPIQTDPSIRALAPLQAAARSLSQVTPTEHDTKYNVQATKAVAAIKPETNSVGTYTFNNSVPTFTQTTLSAYQAGDYISISWELLQDVPQLNSFLTQELNRTVFNWEEGKFISGSGSGEPLGYLNGATPFATEALNLNSVLDLTASLNASYFSRASFLMNRVEFTRLFKTQIAQNQYQSIINYDVTGQARIQAFPVAFSSLMPVYAASPATNGAVLFGDFGSGWIIGDRGGSDIRIKVLDQIGALQGTTTILGYRRTDQRCLIPEAVQMLTTNG